VQHLITLHEFGGLDEADLVQAADSLSFLETRQNVVRSWVMADRIRVPAAARLAEPLASLASLE
jgi:hypothetical protein